jgi:hypothetical protein
MRRQLWIVRHAKSSWDDASLADHDRPLAPRGAAEGKRLAAYINALSEVNFMKNTGFMFFFFFAKISSHFILPGTKAFSRLRLHLASDASNLRFAASCPAKHNARVRKRFIRGISRRLAAYWQCLNFMLLTRRTYCTNTSHSLFCQLRHDCGTQRRPSGRVASARSSGKITSLLCLSFSLSLIKWKDQSLEAARLHSQTFAPCSFAIGTPR